MTRRSEERQREKHPPYCTCVVCTRRRVLGLPRIRDLPPASEHEMLRRQNLPSPPPPDTSDSETRSYGLGLLALIIALCGVLVGVFWLVK